jgi:hypothetical protein
MANAKLASPVAGVRGGNVIACAAYGTLLFILRGISWGFDLRQEPIDSAIGEGAADGLA